MRQIVVDHARSMMTDKRDGQLVAIDLEQLPSSIDQRAKQIVFIDQLLDQLEAIDPDLSRVFECLYFAGYSQQETADLLGLSLRSTQRRWAQACASLRELASEA